MAPACNKQINGSRRRCLQFKFEMKSLVYLSVIDEVLGINIMAASSMKGLEKNKGAAVLLVIRSYDNLWFTS